MNRVGGEERGKEEEEVKKGYWEAEKRKNESARFKRRRKRSKI